MGVSGLRRVQKHRRERYEKISDGIVVKAILWPRQEVIISLARLILKPFAKVGLYQTCTCIWHWGCMISRNRRTTIFVERKDS